MTASRRSACCSSTSVRRMRRPPARCAGTSAEFLADPRVVEIPSLAWRPLLHGVVLRTRPAKSAARYAAIWTKDGSPLAVHTNKQKVLLSGYVGQRLKALGLPADLVVVEQAMRYGTPVDRRRARAAARGRSASASSSCRSIRNTRPAPPARSSTPLRRISRACGACRDCASSTRSTTMPATSRRWPRVVNDYWTRHGQPEHLVLSFHGLPRRSLVRGDPYHCYCQATARLLARELGLESGQWTLAFQSRFGRGRWLEPYTTDDAREAGCGAAAPRRRLLPPASSPTASRRSKSWRSRASGRSRPPAAATTTSSPASTSIRAGSQRSPTSRSRTCKGGWQRRPASPSARRRCSAPRRRAPPPDRLLASCSCAARPARRRPVERPDAGHPSASSSHPSCSHGAHDDRFRIPAPSPLLTTTTRPTVTTPRRTPPARPATRCRRRRPKPPR